MRVNFKAIGIWMILLGCVVAFGQAVFAEGAGVGPQVGVSTLSLQVTGMPGEQVPQAFTVVNLGDQTEEVEIYLADWDYTLQGGNALYAAQTLERSMTGWMQVTPLTLQLAKGESKQVDVNVAIPEGVSGSYWGLILVKTSSRLTSTTDGETRSASFYASKTYGIKVYYTDPVRRNQQGVIRSASVETREDYGLNIHVKFENTGLTYLTPIGKVDIMNEQGHLVETVQVGKFKSLPGYQREMVIPYEQQLAKGNYLALVVLDYGGEELIGAQVEFTVP